MVRVFKLSSGETVIADVIREDEDTLLVRNAQVAAVTPQGLALVPFLPVKPDEQITIKRSAVVCEADGSQLLPELLNGYSQRFGSGITVASKIPEPPKGDKISELKLIKE